jgi:DNA-binding transcriptional regulator YdaS (Cro superfamily)
MTTENHPIRTYLSRVGKSQAWLARQLGIQPTHLNQIISGRKRPSLDLALEIESITGGAVPVSTWRRERKS